MKYALLGLASLGFCLAASCAADPVYDGETDLTITSNVPSRDYSGYKTYRLADDVAELCVQPLSGAPNLEDVPGLGGAGGSSSGCEPADHALDPTVIAALEDQMEKFGYKRLAEDDDQAELLLTVGWIVKGDWDLARPYCYPFTLQPGCVEPITSTGVSLARRVNTPLPPLLVELIDAAESKDEELVTTWTAAIDRQEHSRAYGTTALGGSDAGNLERLIEEGISTAFAQSGYLNRGVAQ